MKIVIVGGVAGGMSAATRLRRLNENAEIIVFDKGPHVSFANCGLPYYVSGEIAEHEDLLLQTPESLHGRFNLDIRVNSEVVTIDSEKKVVSVSGPEGDYTESYDKLILSPGAKPLVPSIVGYEEATNVYSLRNVPDVDAIVAHISKENPKNAVVVGGGFIGLEMAENIKNRGVDVTVIEMAPQILPPLDEEMAAFVQDELEKNGIRVFTGQSANELKNEGKIVVLNDGTELPSDLTILSIGVRPDNSLAESAGLELGMRGGIVVDENYQTSVPDIYAIGDAIIVKQQITGQDTMIALASPANRQGRQVADVVAGYNRKNKGSIGTSIVRVFDLAAASTGLSERSAREAGLTIEVVHTSVKHHAGYFPGATQIEMKLVFNPETGEVYGGQAVGKNGIDKRIDILATAIKGHLTIWDLPELEFTYAPPFGAAKDPVNMIGYAAINLAEGMSDSIQWHELKEERAKGKALLDVRSSEELKTNGYFEDTINIPLNDLRNRLNELDPSKEYIVSCHSGQRSYIAERLLKQKGFKVENLDGAFHLYNTIKPEEIKHV